MLEIRVLGELEPVLGGKRLGLPASKKSRALLAFLVITRKPPARVFAGSGGHPYFAVELAGALARGDDTLPDSLAAMIDDRVARLGPAARSLVPWAAALQRGFDLDRLGQVSSASPAHLLAAIEELEHHRILVVASPPRGAGYDFAHDLVRERVYRALSEPRRRLIHLQIARVLSKASGASAPDGAPDEAAWDTGGEVAHHAALGGDHERAARASLAGGRHALRIFAGEEAGRLARFGLQHARELPDVLRLTLQVALLGVLTQSSTWRARGSELEDEIAERIRECERLGLPAVAVAAFQSLSLVQYENGKRESAGDRSAPCKALAPASRRRTPGASLTRPDA